MATKKEKQSDSFEEYLQLNGTQYPVQVKNVPQNTLNFYLDNPRLYSIVRSGGKEPTEDEILDQLSGMEHVKRLMVSITDHGGLIDPVIVQGGSNVVLEGNSRLAAYRLLARKDAVKWGLIRARILPSNIEEKAVFALLGEYHIHGKKDWVPYEQAGYLYRRSEKHRISAADLAKEIKLPEARVEHLISVYKFMLKHREIDIDRWSYYDEYLKGRKIAKLRKDYGSDLDEMIVKKIRTKEIPTAMDLRDGLRAIVKVGGKNMRQFAEGKVKFKEACESADDQGAYETGLQRIKKYKEWLAETKTETYLRDLAPEHQQKALYDIRLIGKRCEALLKKFPK